MRHRLIVMLVALLASILAGCAPASTPAPAPTSPPANGYSAQATNVPPTQVTASATAVNTPEAVTPAATPDIEKVINIQPADWKRGPDNAAVKIIEWGDFQ